MARLCFSMYAGFVHSEGVDFYIVIIISSGLQLSAFIMCNTLLTDELPRANSSTVKIRLANEMDAAQHMYFTACRAYMCIVYVIFNIYTNVHSHFLDHPIFQWGRQTTCT